MDLIHVSIGGSRGVLRIAAVLTRVQVRRVPIPPVMRGMRLLVLTMMLPCFVQELCEGCNILGLYLRRLPFATGKPGCDLLQ